MGYSENSAMVRVDFFKESGKWYTTEAVEWVGSYEEDIMRGFAQSLVNHLKGRLSDMDAVCLHPYHKYEYPIQIKQGEWENWR